jgi:hypothetical protein
MTQSPCRAWNLSTVASSTSPRSRNPNRLVTLSPSETRDRSHRPKSGSSVSTNAAITNTHLLLKFISIKGKLETLNRLSRAATTDWKSPRVGEHRNRFKRTMSCPPQKNRMPRFCPERFRPARLRLTPRENGSYDLGYRFKSVSFGDLSA